MNRPMGCGLLAGALCVLAIAVHVGARFDKNVTVYMLSCDGAQMGGSCEGTEKTDVPFTYHVSIDQRAVMYWRANDPALVRRFAACAIHDFKNWLCEWRADSATKTMFGLQAGRYVEIGTCVSAAAGQMYYQVSAWRWWRVRVREWLFSPMVRSVRMPSKLSH